MRSSVYYLNNNNKKKKQGENDGSFSAFNRF